MGPGRTSRAWYFHTPDCQSVSENNNFSVKIPLHLLVLFTSQKHKSDNKRNEIIKYRNEFTIVIVQPNTVPTCYEGNWAKCFSNLIHINKHSIQRLCFIICFNLN